MTDFNREFCITPSAWKKLRDSKLRISGLSCFRCGNKFRYKKHLIVHHIISIANGGENKLENLEVICQSCNKMIIMNLDTYFTDEIKPHGYADKTRPDWHKVVYGGSRNPEN